MPRKKNTTTAYPMIPLRGLMVFPRMILHFDVGRAPSVAALEKAMLKNQLLVLMVQRDEEKEEHARKLTEREAVRLRSSFEAAKADGYKKYIMFLHYPPTSILQDDSRFTQIAEEYGAEQVIYAHSHGESRFHDSIEGEKNGIRYQLVSGDYLKWKPYQVM